MRSRPGDQVDGRKVKPFKRFPFCMALDHRAKAAVLMREHNERFAEYLGFRALEERIVELDAVSDI